MNKYILAIDQGTTNSRAILFDSNGEVIHKHEMMLQQSFPQDGWVEQDPLEMFNNTLTCCREVLKASGISPEMVAGIGITNQRETTILWDKKSGDPIYPAIVWQDRRTSELCEQLLKQPIGKKIQEKTGLIIDPYFSATKIVWLLQTIPELAVRAQQGEILFGTVDSFLLWKLTKGAVHKTDITNASRTMLFNIHEQCWDLEILQALNIPKIILPEVFDNAADFGYVDSSFLGVAVPILAMAGDQQAATIGQRCFQTGMLKVTYGTGCFMVLNTGPKVIVSANRLLSTIAYRVKGKIAYALEGSIFSAGVTIKWLRDTLHLIATAAESETLAQAVESTEGVYLVPAFTGLGAPYWNPNARAAILGLTRNSNKNHMVRAGLESVGYQSKDLLEAMSGDTYSTISSVQVDGGMTANQWLLQFLADILNVEIKCPHCIETTALGVAYLVALQLGWFSSLEDIAKISREHKTFRPKMTHNKRDSLYNGWKKAVEKVN